MKSELQIKALAELDGWDDIREGFGVETRYGGTESETRVTVPCLPYLTSYDAIIPLIQRQMIGRTMPTEIDDRLPVGVYFYNATPSQLCEALLRATNKWSEE